jgi:hypothetical protein
MSYITNKAHNASKRIDSLKRKLCATELAEGEIPADVWVNSIVKIAIIFIIGIFIIQGVVSNSGVNNTSAPFYSLLVSVTSNITSGYTLASLVVLVIGAAAIIHFLGFI